MPGHARSSKCLAVVLGGLLVVVLGAPAAPAYPFRRVLARGDRGKDVRVLEIRVAGWFPRRGQHRLRVDRHFGVRTRKAVKGFQRRHGLAVDGIAGPQTFRALNRIEDPNGSTKHFNYSEFRQNRNRACSARANSYARSFKGGMTSPRRTRKNVRRLMWRLEAVRDKGGDNPMGINSAFRSVPYNRCIGGASASQHLYGTAADNRIARVGNHRARKVARRSQVHGIECYSSLTHNHFDLRLENRDLRSSQHWWWPKRDRRRRDLDYSGRPCWGERKRGVATTSLDVSSVEEIEAFERAGEPADLRGGD